MFSPWRNRLLLDYAEFITNEALLPRSCGAPFLGSGEKYFSCIDDPEIELIKALWEGEDYLRIPPARRVWGCEWVDRNAVMADALRICTVLQLFETGESTCLSLPELRRGVLIILAAQIKQLTEVKVGLYYQLALDSLKKYCSRYAPLQYVQDILVSEKENRLDG
jgi:hypothetical protein